MPTKVNSYIIMHRQNTGKITANVYVSQLYRIEHHLRTRTRLQLGKGAFVWLVRSPGIVSHWTFVPHYIINFQEQAELRHILSHVLTPLTNCFAEYEQQTLYTAPLNV